MIYVGIDVAKLNHFASAILSNGKILIKPFKFKDDGDGFQQVLSKPESIEQGDIIIGFESTAHYGDNLVSCCFKVCVKTNQDVYSAKKQHS